MNSGRLWAAVVALSFAASLAWVFTDRPGYAAWHAMLTVALVADVAVCVTAVVVAVARR